MNNQKYNSFYYIHIPKAGGRFFKYNISDPIYKVCSENNIKFLKDTEPNYPGPGHNQWTDFIDDSTYIACTFRDPIKHSVSLYAHIQTLDERGEPKNFKKDELNKKDFVEWYEKNIINLSNYQSRHIVSSSTETVETFSDRLKFIDSSNIDLLINRIKRINMFINIDNIAKDDINNIQKKILDSLNITSHNVFNHTPKYKTFENIFSKSLYNLLDINDKNYILKNNIIDSQILLSTNFNIKEQPLLNYKQDILK